MKYRTMPEENTQLWLVTDEGVLLTESPNIPLPLLNCGDSCWRKLFVLIFFGKQIRYIARKQLWNRFHLKCNSVGGWCQQRHKAHIFGTSVYSKGLYQQSVSCLLPNISILLFNELLMSKNVNIDGFSKYHHSPMETKTTSGTSRGV
jgi:hypothetical protein